MVNGTKFRFRGSKCSHELPLFAAIFTQTELLNLRDSAAKYCIRKKNLLLHTVPFPSKPASQVHKKLPIVSVQSALRSQSLRVSLAHSSISALTNNIHSDGYCISSMLAGRSCELTSAVDSTSTKARVARASEATNYVTAGSIGITIVHTSHTLINICHYHRG